LRDREPRKAIADSDIAALGRAVEFREILDLADLEAGDVGGPFRCSGRQMALQLLGRIGIFGQIGTIGVTVTKGNMHHCTGQRRIGPRPQGEVEVGDGGTAGAVGVDHDHPRTTLPSRL
jgi:hypothetical protein